MTPKMNSVAKVPDVAPVLDGLGAFERVRVRDGELITDSLVISDAFGRRHDNVMKSLRSLVADGTLRTLDFKETSYLDRWSRPQSCIELTEAGALIAMPFIGGRKSRQGQTILVHAFIAMRAQLRQLQPAPAPHVRTSTSKLTAELAVAECIARLTHVSESGKLAMIHQICLKNAVDVYFLPTHAVDGPPGTVSSQEAETATELLRRRGKGASATSFNQRAKLAGYLRETSRPTNDRKKHPDGRKRYLIITSKGEAFGKNVVDIQSPRQTQPRWYSERFDVFCKLLWSETKGSV